MTAAHEVATRCPACNHSVLTQRETYLFARPYLCPSHKNIWDSADEREHRTGCPWLPGACHRCGRAA